MTLRFSLLFITALAAAVMGCAERGIVQLSPDTYMLSKQDRAGIFGNVGSLKVDVIREANSFAESHGKIAIPVSAHEVPAIPGRFARFEYQFRVVEKDDPEARRTSLVESPDFVIDKTEKSIVDIHTKDQTEKPRDVYAELIKLDDLKKKGIITEVEFEAQKKKLLDSN